MLPQIIMCTRVYFIEFVLFLNSIKQLRNFLFYKDIVCIVTEKGISLVFSETIYSVRETLSFERETYFKI